MIRQWNGLHEYYTMETQKCEIFSKSSKLTKLNSVQSPYPEFPYAEKKNHPGFVNISPTLVIDTSTERSSRVLATTRKPKI